MIALASQPPAVLFWARGPQSPAGPLLAGFDEKGALCRLSFLAGTTREAVLNAWAKEWPHTLFRPAPKRLKSLPKQICLVGTPFQQKVWKELLKIPAGKTVSYGELARRIKKPKAARAVGAALGANPVPLLVPCHRVIAGDGGLGGFSGGLGVKKRLLTHEGAVFR